MKDGHVLVHAAGSGLDREHLVSQKKSGPRTFWMEEEVGNVCVQGGNPKKRHRVSVPERNIVGPSRKNWRRESDGQKGPLVLCDGNTMGRTGP